jgi:hypothetical protein
MKQIFISICFFLFIIQFVQGQKIDTTMNKTPQVLYNMYMQKHKSNKTIGWILFGSGLGMAGIGMTIFGKQDFEASTNKGITLAFAGGISMLGSIPFFISAGNNKRKAKLALKTEPVIIGSKKRLESNYFAFAIILQL